MTINIVFDDNEILTVVHTGDLTYPEWSKHFFSARYYCLNNDSEIGNKTIDTNKVKYVELVG